MRDRYACSLVRVLGSTEEGIAALKTAVDSVDNDKNPEGRDKDLRSLMELINLLNRKLNRQQQSGSKLGKEVEELRQQLQNERTGD